MHFPASDVVLARFVCRTATKKSNEIHSDPRFLEGKQMGGHFFKVDHSGRSCFFFFNYEEGLLQLYMKIYYSALGKGLNLVSAW